MSRGRWAVVVLAAGLTLAGVLVGWPWLRPAVIEPLALVLWLTLRLFVLSLHQAVFWAGLVLAATASLVALLRRRAIAASPPPGPSPLRFCDPVESWRQRIERAASGAPPAPTIGWDPLRRLVVSLRALELRVPPDHRLHDALRDGRLPLPPGVHAYLFPAPPRDRGLPRLAACLRHLGGRARTRRLEHLSELLSYLEDSLEMPRHAPAPGTPRPIRPGRAVDG